MIAQTVRMTKPEEVSKELYWKIPSILYYYNASQSQCRRAHGKSKLLVRSLAMLCALIEKEHAERLVEESKCEPNHNEGVDSMPAK